MTAEQRSSAPQRTVRVVWLSSAIVLATAVGCTGSIGDDGPMTGGTGVAPGDPANPADPANPGDPANPVDPDDPANPGDPSTPGDQPIGDGTRPLTEVVGELCAAQGDQLRVGRTLLRRITRKQFNNTVRDLIGASGDAAALISPDEKIGPFYSNAQTPIVDLVVQQHAEAAATLAADAVTNMGSIAPCDLATGGETCAQQFIDQFGLRAYRRPLEQVERDAYVALYEEASAAGGPSEGFRYVVETMLQSPFFLYHVDVGTSGAPSATPVQLNGYELASRLSYFLWNSMPDAQLFQLASTGELLDTTVLEAEVARMLNDPRAMDAIPEFHLQWLGVGEMAEVVKDQALFPSFGQEMVDAMLAETANFSSYVIREGDGLMSTLFTANYSIIDGPLFALYGAAQPAGFVPGQTVTLDPTQRSGLLTQASFLATHAHRDQTSPVHRGIAIRENLLCQTLEPPPADVNNVPPSPSEATTTRERFAQHTANPTCANCHRLVDPIGLGLENYDPMGAFRSIDGPAPVDATGEIVDAGADVEGPFNGAIELSQKLATSQQVADCMANQWFRFALGRIEANDDACALKSIYEGFAASGRNVRELITRLVLSDAFRYVRHEAGQENM